MRRPYVLTTGKSVVLTPPSGVIPEHWRRRLGTLFAMDWYRRFDRWLRARAERHVASDTYKRREKSLYSATGAAGRAFGWNPRGRGASDRDS